MTADHDPDRRHDDLSPPDHDDHSTSSTGGPADGGADTDTPSDAGADGGADPGLGIRGEDPYDDGASFKGEDPYDG